MEIIDNINRLLGDDLKQTLKPGARLQIAASCFSMEITNDYGRKAIKSLFGAAVMDFPKSPDLMAKLVRIGSHKDSLIIDFSLVGWVTAFTRSTKVRSAAISRCPIMT